MVPASVERPLLLLPLVSNGQGLPAKTLVAFLGRGAEMSVLFQKTAHLVAVAASAAPGTTVGRLEDEATLVLAMGSFFCFLPARAWGRGTASVKVKRYYTRSASLRIGGPRCRSLLCLTRGEGVCRAA
ncbi:hypothetical protein TRVL_04475 [Trypanosoma vivax]|nr:hypothetical protein TRVL_04475 [Trypanosoma vivax]